MRTCEYVFVVQKILISSYQEPISQFAHVKWISASDLV